MKFFSTLLVIAFIPGFAFSHQTFEPELGLNINSVIAASYSNKGLSDDTLWHVQGALMGGEAFGTEDGFSLDEASLHLEYGTEDNTQLNFEIGSHGHHGASEIELEQAYAAQYWELDSDAEFRAEVGRMKALFSPLNENHQDKNINPNSPLAYSVFWGDGYVDTGLRFISKSILGSGGVFYGFEAWEGEGFPSTSGSGGGSYDAFAYYLYEGGKPLLANIGLWHFYGKAKNRSDERLDSNHNHSSTATLTNISINGKTHVSALYVDLNWKFTNGNKLSWINEYQWLRFDGRIRNTTQQAEIESRYQGWISRVEYQIGDHAIAFQYDWLGLENTLTGAGATALASEAQLINNNDPKRYALLYAYQASKDLSLRISGMSDTTSTKEINSVSVGLVLASSIFE